MSSYKRKADTDKLKKEIKGLKEQKKVWQDIVQVKKVGNLLKEKSKLLSEIQEMKKETRAGGKESAALTNKKVQQRRECCQVHLLTIQVHQKAYRINQLRYNQCQGVNILR